MKRFCYHREFWMDFHFWILVLLLAAVAYDDAGSAFGS